MLRGNVLPLNRTAKMFICERQLRTQFYKNIKTLRHLIPIILPRPVKVCLMGWRLWGPYSLKVT